MKTATTFYKQTFANNLSTSLEALVKGQQLNLVAKDTYAITAPELEALRAKLA
jgi:hypothetical protein